MPRHSTFRSPGPLPTASVLLSLSPSCARGGCHLRLVSRACVEGLARQRMPPQPKTVPARHQEGLRRWVRDRIGGFTVVFWGSGRCKPETSCFSGFSRRANRPAVKRLVLDRAPLSLSPSFHSEPVSTGFSGSSLKRAGIVERENGCCHEPPAVQCPAYQPVHLRRELPTFDENTLRRGSATQPRPSHTTRRLRDGPAAALRFRADWSRECAPATLCCAVPAVPLPVVVCGLRPIRRRRPCHAKTALH